MPQPEWPAGLVVIEPIRDWKCAECATTGDPRALRAAREAGRGARGSHSPSSSACLTGTGHGFALPGGSGRGRLMWPMLRYMMPPSGFWIRQMSVHAHLGR
jgi:hypothetical protein